MTTMTINGQPVSEADVLTTLLYLKKGTAVTVTFKPAINTDAEVQSRLTPFQMLLSYFETSIQSNDKESQITFVRLVDSSNS